MMPGFRDIFGGLLAGSRRARVGAWGLVVAVVLWLMGSGVVLGQYRMDRPTDPGGAAHNPNVPNPPIVDKAGVQLPLELEFRDIGGKKVPLNAYFNQGRPVVVTLVYFSCPSLCTFTQENLAAAVRQGPRGLSLGKDYDILIVSIDPEDRPKAAALKRENYLAKIPLPENQPGFNYLIGSEKNIKELADTLGFGYRRQFVGDKYLHSAGIFICTPEGRLSQTIVGITYEADALHNALRVASSHAVGSGMLGFALSCGAMKFNPNTGRYEHNVWFYVGMTGALITLIFVITLLSILWRGEFRKNKHPFGKPDAEPRIT